MNGPQRTACFAKGMPNFEQHRVFIYSGHWVIQIGNRSLNADLLTCNPLTVRCLTRQTHTDGQLSILRFAPALNEPLRNNETCLAEQVDRVPIPPSTFVSSDLYMLEFTHSQPEVTMSTIEVAMPFAPFALFDHLTLGYAALNTNFVFCNCSGGRDIENKLQKP